MNRRELQQTTRMSIRKHTGTLIACLVFLMLIFVNTVHVIGADEAHDIVDPVGQKDNCTAVLYNNTNRLPTSEANAVAETSEGFIWIGSYSGLVRYDGNVFERIDASAGLGRVPEATDAQNQMFGTARMVDALNRGTDASPQELLNSINSAVREFVDKAEQFDDMTMLCLEYCGIDTENQEVSNDCR